MSSTTQKATEKYTFWVGNQEHIFSACCERDAYMQANKALVGELDGFYGWMDAIVPRTFFAQFGLFD